MPPLPDRTLMSPRGSDSDKSVTVPQIIIVGNKRGLLGLNPWSRQSKRM
jgi:hypothetical protein